MKSVILAGESLRTDEGAILLGKGLESSVYIVKILALSVLKFCNKRADLTDYNRHVLG